MFVVVLFVLNLVNWGFNLFAFCGSGYAYYFGLQVKEMLNFFVELKFR